MLRCRVESLGVSLPGGGPWRGSLWHAAKAGTACLARSRYRRSDIEVLVNTGVHRDGHRCEPAMAVYVLRALGINTEFRGARTLGFDLTNGGCGMLNAAHVLQTMIQAGQARVGLIVSSETNCDADPDPGFVYPSSGAAALLDVAPRADQGFGAFAFRTDDNLSDLYASVVSLAQKHGRILLRRAAELEDAYLSAVGAVVDEVLARDELTRDAIDCVVPAQISGRFVARLAGAAGLPAQRILDLTGRLADTLSTSVFLALDEALRSGRLATGMRALLVACGSGITVGAATYRA
jgi:3-oxoacyl-[acyl-carrier-protein] synthase-3